MQTMQRWGKARGNETENETGNQTRIKDVNDLKMNQNILLDFSHIYPTDVEKGETGLRRVDLSDIEGTNMYCSREAAEEIKKRLKDTGPEGIHFLDNGNYHYVTLFFAEKIQTPFSLVLFDHHTDMQKPLVPQLLSCGSWARELMDHHASIEQLILIGPERKTLETIEPQLRERIICVSIEEIIQGKAEQDLARIKASVPVYISIDKDVLSPRYARTNWNQGEMTMKVLERLLLEIFKHQKVIGADICGECSPLEPLEKLIQDEQINRETNEGLYHFLERLFGKEYQEK